MPIENALVHRRSSDAPETLAREKAILEEKNSGKPANVRFVLSKDKLSLDIRVDH